MDRIDRNILAELARDAGIRNTELADRVGLAPSSCLRRVRRLKASGAIRRVVAEIDPAVLGHAVRALVLVALAEHAGQRYQAIVARLLAEPAVQHLYSVSGAWDLNLLVAAPAMDAYQDLSDRLFSANPLILRFETHFILKDFSQA